MKQGVSRVAGGLYSCTDRQGLPTSGENVREILNALSGG